MANELRHSDVGTALSKSEWEAVGSHILNSQAAGDIIYASSTSQLTRLGIGAAKQFLVTNDAGTAPAWTSSPAVVTAITPDASDGATLGTAALEWSDLYLADAAVIYFGDDDDVTLTHVHNDGLLLNLDNQLQFRDSAINIRSDADGDLDINADDEIELNSTLIDINGNVEVSGTFEGAGLMTTGGNIVIPNAGNIGSASDTDSIAISSAGVVTMNQIPVFSAGINVSGGTIAGTLATAAQGNVTSLGTLTALQVDYVNVNDRTITITDDGDTGDYASIAVTDHGATTLATVDDDATAAHLTLDVDGNITLDADGGTITFADAGSGLGTITSAGYSGNAAGLSATLAVTSGGTGATSLTDKAVLISQDTGTDAVGSVALTSSGQIIIGGSSGPAAATLSAGSNITITNGDGSISIAAASAGTPSGITVADSSDTTSFVAFFESATGDLGPKTDSQLTYNATSGVLTAAGFAGPITGNVTGNASGSAGTVTAGTQASITTVANVVEVGALDAGSITSGFGAIDNGTSNIRTATITAETAVVPDIASGATLGTAALEWGHIYVGDDQKIYLGDAQDVSLEYDEDGTDQLRIAGNTIFENQVQLDKDLLLDPTPANTVWSGITAKFTAGEDLEDGECVYLKAADTKMWKAVANTGGTGLVTAEIMCVAMCVSDVSADAEGTFLLQGFLRADTNFPTYAIGETLYLPEAEVGGKNVPEGAAPDTNGDFVQVIGWAADANTVYFSPNFTMVEVA